MADELVKLSEAAASPAEFRCTAVKTFQKPWKSLSQILKSREEWHKRAKELQLGLTVGTRKQGANRFLKKGALKPGKGNRKLGAGRKDAFVATKQRVKAWLERGRMMQHAVDSSDLMEAFLDDVKEEECLLQRKLSGQEVQTKKVETVQEESNLPGFNLLQSLEDFVNTLEDEAAKQRLEECKSRLQKLQQEVGYRKSFARRLVQDVGGRLHTPGRLTQLTLQEEEQNVAETWLEFDAALQLAAFGTEEQLGKFVENPADFEQNRQDLTIGWSDQIPCWLKMSRGAQVYPAAERAKKSRMKTADYQKLQDETVKALEEAADIMQQAKAVEDAAAASAEDTAAAVCAAGEEAEAAAAEEPEAAAEAEEQQPDTAEKSQLQQALVQVLKNETELGDTTLRRGVGSSEDEKWRCAVEHRLILKNYLKPGAVPEAQN